MEEAVPCLATSRQRHPTSSWRCSTCSGPLQHVLRRRAAGEAAGNAKRESRSRPRSSHRRRSMPKCDASFQWTALLASSSLRSSHVLSSLRTAAGYRGQRNETWMSVDVSDIPDITSASFLGLLKPCLPAVGMLASTC